VILIDDVGHLASDTSWEELHHFASLIGLRREWFQDHPKHPHYDCTTERKRQTARHFGAELVGTREMMLRMYEAGLWQPTSPLTVEILRKQVRG
jgi:hypothetical protein